jgi:hypothetical protein
MKQLLILAGVLALGFAAGWLLSPGPFRHWYKSSKEIVLVDIVDGKQRIIGRIPKGTLVVADRRLSPHGEIGWWGYVAVLLGTETEARQVLAETSERVTSGTQALIGGPPESFPDEEKAKKGGGGTP